MAQSPENHPAARPDEPLPELPADLSSPGLSSPDLSSPDLSSPDLVTPDYPPAVSPDLLPPEHERPARVKVPHTRTSAAWFGIWAGVAALILLIIFVAQNTASVQVNFLWMSGQFSLAVALLVAGVGGAVVAMAFAAARILQLRRLVKRGR